MATNNTTTKRSSGPTKAELEAQIAILKAQLEEAKAAASNAAPVSNPTPTYTVPPTTDVTIVYCSDSMGYAKVGTSELYFNRFGEEFVISRQQFDELVGKYRRWFDKGILAVSSKCIDIAAAKGVRTDKEYNINYAKLESMAKMNTIQLENFWNGLEKDAHKESVVTFFKRKFIEGDSAFRDRAKIDLMNRLTNGGFAREQDELSGRYTIQPTELL